MLTVSCRCSRPVSDGVVWIVSMLSSVFDVLVIRFNVSSFWLERAVQFSLGRALNLFSSR